MYHRIIILALLFLCSEKTNSKVFHISPMEISDALPVQFWLTGCATFNEHHAPGVFHKCFCAPWECDDQIKVQFTDDPSQNYSLEIYDLEESLLGTIAFDEVYTGVYEAILNLAEDSPDVCDQLIELRIKKEAGVQGVTLPSLNSWLQTTEISVGAVDWTLGSAPQITLTSLFFPGVVSEILYVDFAFISGVEYVITVNYTKVVNVSGQNPRTIRIIILDDSFTFLDSDSGSTPTSGELSSDPGPRDFTTTFTAPSGATKLGIQINEGSNTTYTINSVTATRSIGSPEIVAKSDCLDIRQNHDETILLTFSNHRNFAGLVYQNTSPNTTFDIRIPAIFFHQRFPEEDEVMELSNELATLNGTLRKQRLLDTDYLPYYFHEKVKLILKHQSLSVFNREWVKQEAYQITEGNRLAPLKKAQCWLSEKEFVHRNIL